MADGAEPGVKERDRLITWALGTFHAGALLVAATLVLHATGNLAALLSGLSTAVGLALFGALWGTTIWSTHRTLAGVIGTSLATTVPTGRLLIRATLRGGVNGILFLALAGIIVAVPTILSSPGGILFLILFLATSGLIGAFVVGCLVGLLFASIDLMLFASARALLR
jgi:hypothetical protein